MEGNCANCGKVIGAEGKQAHICFGQPDLRAPTTAGGPRARSRLGAPPSMKDSVPTTKSKTTGTRTTRANVMPTVDTTSTGTAPMPSLATAAPPTPLPANTAAPIHFCCSTSPNEGTASATNPKEGDVRIEFHPRAKRASLHLTFDEYEKTKIKINVNKIQLEPWSPAFQTRFDFELAQFALTTGLNQGEVTRLLDLFTRYKGDPEQLTLQSYDEMQMAWDAASSKQASFKESPIDIEYDSKEGKTKKSYSVWHRDPWAWGTSLAKDPLLAPNFVYHSCRQYRYINGEWVRFVSEPHTADDFWDAETSLPEGAHPLAFEIYADKTRLSTFGTQKAYPVIARLANLPMHLRHSSGYGGGQFIGFLPIVEEEEEEGEEKFIKHKRIVWHESAWQILENMAKWAGFGDMFRCGDDIARVLIPIIIILIADYEEQAMMALIRGLRSLFPCPICLVPRDEQDKLYETPVWPRRTVEDSKAVVMGKMSDTEREVELKKRGLRPVENVFWKFPRCDPYRALSFDTLHAYHGGLYRDHLHAQFQDIIKSIGRVGKIQVNGQFNAIDRWRNLNHFNQVTAVTFADASKYEDMSKESCPSPICTVIVPAAYNTVVHIPRGRRLFKAIRCYNRLDAYAGLRIHTTHTVKSYEQELPRFSAAIAEYKEVHPEKSWLFPKDHTQQHAPADIMAKGVLANMSAKPGEKAHSLPKHIYRERTNFKDSSRQIARIEGHHNAAHKISFELEALDTFMSPPAQLDGEKHNARFQFGHVYVGTRDDQPRSIGEIAAAHEWDPGFIQFQARFSHFIGQIVKVTKGPGQQPEPVRVTSDTQLVQAKMLRVQYTSEDTWSETYDLLRCSPRFHGRPRYDCVIFKADQRGTLCFGRLQAIFIYDIPVSPGRGGAGQVNRKVPFALVKVFDPVRAAQRSQLDQDLGLCRVRGRMDVYAGTTFIHLGAIVRGALLIADYGDSSELHETINRSGDRAGRDAEDEPEDDSDMEDLVGSIGPKQNDWFVADLIDGDMFLRCRRNFGELWDT